MTTVATEADVIIAAITAAKTTAELHAALRHLLLPGRWDVRCNRWGLVFYPAEQTKPKALT